MKLEDVQIGDVILKVDIDRKNNWYALILIVDKHSTGCRVYILDHSSKYFIGSKRKWYYSSFKSFKGKCFAA